MKRSLHFLPVPRWLIASSVALVVAAGMVIALYSPRSSSIAAPASASTDSVRTQPDSELSHSETGANSPLSPPAGWEAEWRGYLARPPGPERDALLAASLNSLGAVAPTTAAERLCELHPTDRVSVVAVALQAYQHRPNDAVREAIRFCDEDPSYSYEYGQALISSLSSSGNHLAALRFVLAEELEGWLGENGNKWLTSLFTAWATVAPQQAMQAVDLLVGPGLRGEALQAVAAGWSKKDPSALANFAAQLPSSQERDLMLAATWWAWTATDPASAEAWAQRRKTDLNADAARSADSH